MWRCVALLCIHAQSTIINSRGVCVRRRAFASSRDASSPCASLKSFIIRNITAAIERLKSRAAEAKRPGPGLNGSEPEYTPAHVGLAAVFSRCAVWITVSGRRRLGGGVARGFCTYTVHRTVYYVTVYGVFRTNPTVHGARCTGWRPTPTAAESYGLAWTVSRVWHGKIFPIGAGWGLPAKPAKAPFDPFDPFAGSIGALEKG